MRWLRDGWQVFEAERATLDWLEAAGPAALSAIGDAALRDRWLRHGGTWFVGVDALPNGEDGRVAGGVPLRGAALAAAERVWGRLPLHRAQVSAVWPGYPIRDADESASAHRYRRDRDGAHLDGLLPEGAAKRRHLRECHAWILGVAVTSGSDETAPLVLWEGSHRHVRQAFARVLGAADPRHWGEVDLTDVYQAARSEVFARCTRRSVPLKRGQAVLLHRQTIHGIAPWSPDTDPRAEGRITLYFRPEVAKLGDWLTFD